MAERDMVTCLFCIRDTAHRIVRLKMIGCEDFDLFAVIGALC